MRAFQKHVTCSSFLPIEKTSVAIGQCRSMDGDRFFFKHHPTHLQHQMVIEIFNRRKGCEHVLSFWEKKFNLRFLCSAIEHFQSPSNGVGVVDDG